MHLPVELAATKDTFWLFLSCFSTATQQLKMCQLWWSATLILTHVTLKSCLQSNVQKSELSTAVRKALYASKICSYAQGLNIIRAKSISMGWNIEMGELTRIWKVRLLSPTSSVSMS